MGNKRGCLDKRVESTTMQWVNPLSYWSSSTRDANIILPTGTLFPLARIAKTWKGLYTLCYTSERVTSRSDWPIHRIWTRKPHNSSKCISNIGGLWFDSNSDSSVLTTNSNIIHVDFDQRLLCGRTGSLICDAKQYQIT